MAVLVGSTAFVRASGEEVFVLGRAVRKVMDEVEGEGFYVRRPVGGRDGIRHQIDFFLAGELYTQEERLKQEYADRKAVQDQIFGTKGLESQKDFGLN